MKKVIFIAVLVVINLAAIQAQITKPVKGQQKTIIQSQPQQPPAVVSVYSLTAVRVNIRTGNDNKEFPSRVDFELWAKNHQAANYTNDCFYKINNLKNEMSVNSTTEYGLEKTGGTAEKYTLESIQKTGLTLNIGYTPNFFMDAWKIESISFTLEFKDQNGNMHPVFGSKTISFGNSPALLNSDYRYLVCTTDQNFNPLTASIEKQPK